MTLSSTNTPSTSFEVPFDSVTPPAAQPGQTIHMILEVTDSGSPSLASYQRVVITVAARATTTPTGTVTPMLSLALGTAPTLGSFVTGTAATYSATSTVTVTSTAGDAVLTAGDASPIAPGHLVNGTSALASPLQIKADSAAGVGGDLQPLAALTSPVRLLAYSGPVVKDPVTVSYQQAIGATEPLRSGSYSKGVTFTLATTDP